MVGEVTETRDAIRDLIGHVVCMHDCREGRPVDDPDEELRVLSQDARSADLRRLRSCGGLTTTYTHALVVSVRGVERPLSYMLRLEA